jgi:cytochrome c biogenesis protein CcmG, thiol:disulfide interchange protein DsbE
VRLALVISVCAVLVAGCGSHPKSAAPSKAAEEKALAGSPPALASIHKEGSQLVGGGTDAFKQRLATLRGHGVVVNKWAAWCGPCRQEFPVFQQASVKFGKNVAFLGVDSNDNNGDAKTFLKQFPVSYPSYSDPNLKIAETMNAVGAFPTTVIYDSQGKIANTHIGPYTSDAALAADIRRYAR